ncbi:choice-of-anchor Q domain-containing protein [Chloroflexota bacterium]
MVKTQKPISIMLSLVLAFSLALTGTLSLSQPVYAADIHVTTAAELQNALDQAATNGTDDTIYLAAGTYVGNFKYADAEDWSLTIQGELGTTAQDVVLDGSDTGTVLELDGFPSGIVYAIRGITLRNGSEGGLFLQSGYSGRINLRMNSVIIEDNFESSFGAGIGLEVYYQGGSINAEIYDSIIRNNHAGKRGGGIYAYSTGGESSLDLLLVNCLIYGNQADWTGGGVNIGAGETGDNNSTDATILNCTITDNRLTDTGSNVGAGIYMVAYAGNGTEATLDLYNTIVYGNTLLDDTAQDLGIREADTGMATVNVYACDIGDIPAFSGTPTYNETNIINTDPAFINATVGDYHLTAGSPCLDSGTALVPDPPGLPQTDIEGNPRIMGTAPDMGAYEYTGTQPEPTIGSSPSTLTFVAFEGGFNPLAQTLDIWNSGAGTLDWSVVGASWIDLSPNNGISTGETDIITVSVDVSGKAAGDYDANITISDPLASNTPQSVPVHLTVNPLPPIVDEPNAAEGFASIAPFLETAYGFKTGEGSGGWTVYNPLWPSQVNTLTTFYVARGYWINVSDACTLQYGSQSYDLDAGWNLLGWLPQDTLPPYAEVDVITGLESIQDELMVAYCYKSGEGVGGWTTYNPSWPGIANTLSTLYVSRGYWINVSEACILQFGSTVIVLDQPGWNLIGWIPQQ